MNGHNRPTVDDATWFDIQVRCLEQLRTMFQYLGDLEPPKASHQDLFILVRNTIQILLQSMEHNARKQ